MDAQPLNTQRLETQRLDAGRSDARRSGVTRPAGPKRLRWAGAASGTLHALALAALFWRPSLGAAFPPPDPATLQVEFVSQPATSKGAPAAARPPTPPDPASVPASAPVPPPPPTPAGVMPPSTPPAAAAPAQLAVHLGDSDEDRDALTVTGDVVSSGPDPRYRNKPPGYPRAALLLHEEGTVQVLIHVASDGAVESVELVGSSGSAALDEAGVSAVEKWRFVPALREGVPVPSVYPLAMHFKGHE